MTTSCRLIVGDSLAALREMAAGSAQCCVTSPPYYGLRDYGHAGQIGLEPTPGEYVGRLVAVFREVRRVLRDDGTLWVNIGDSYNAYNGGAGPSSSEFEGRRDVARPKLARGHELLCKLLKPKDLIGVPWAIAFALREDGWYLRQDIIWAKPNPMPESIRDRCTKAHEYLFLLAKSQRYHCDMTAIKEEAAMRPQSRRTPKTFERAGTGRRDGQSANAGVIPPRSEPARDYDGRNKRSVWTVSTKSYKGAHFAVMPEAIVEPCVLAGCPEGGVVIDPFCGSGTVCAVAVRLGRHAIGVDINADYAELARRRVTAAASSMPLYDTPQISVERIQ